MALHDLPEEVQAQIKAQAETFSEGDVDTIDTPNEQRALQKILLGLDSSLTNSNPQLQQLQQFARPIQTSL